MITFTVYKWICFIIGNIVLFMLTVMLLRKTYDVALPVRRVTLGVLKRTYLFQWYERYINWAILEAQLANKEDQYEKQQWLDDLRVFVTESNRMKKCMYQSFYIERIEKLIFDHRIANNLI